MKTKTTAFKGKGVKFLPAILAASVISLTSCEKDELMDMPAEAFTSPDANSANQESISISQIPNQYIVVYKDGQQAEQSEEAVAQSILKNQDKPLKGFKAFAHGIKGFAAEMSSADAEALRQDSRVAYVEPDQQIILHSAQSTSNTVAVSSTQVTSWGATKVGMGNGLATGRTAWIIDSGIQLNHPDLNVDVARSKSFVTGTTSPDDEFGHGTNVAGIIGAKDNTIGVKGVAAGAKLVSLRVMNASGAGSVSAVIAALMHVAKFGAPGDVVNLSLGSAPSLSLDNAVLLVANKGIYVTIAAGNSGANSANYSPARVNHTNVFTVSGMRADNTFMGISNWGSPVDYAAPGTALQSTKKGSTYGSVGGTSMASPHVAALLLLKGKAFTTQGTVLNDPDGVADRIPKL